jgi:trans-aconitate methyltransferase
MKIPREPDKERIGDEEAVRAYDRVGRWPIFMLERRIMLHEMKKYCPRGVLVDIGCGPGYLVALVKQQFPRVDVIGLDIDGRVTRLAKGNPAFTPDTKLEFWTGDV